jgi:hypothetical protein
VLSQTTLSGRHRCRKRAWAEHIQVMIRLDRTIAIITGNLTRCRKTPWSFGGWGESPIGNVGAERRLCENGESAIRIASGDLMKCLPEGEDQTQGVLLPEFLDGYVAEDNPVR